MSFSNKLSKLKMRTPEFVIKLDRDVISLWILGLQLTSEVRQSCETELWSKLEKITQVMNIGKCARILEL
jgi:hypothetical protein